MPGSLPWSEMAALEELHTKEKLLSMEETLPIKIHDSTALPLLPNVAESMPHVAVSLSFIRKSSETTQFHFHFFA